MGNWKPPTERDCWILVVYTRWTLGTKRFQAISRFVWPQIWSEEALELVKIWSISNRFQEWTQLFSLWFCSFERCQNHSQGPTRLSDAAHGYIILQQWFRFFQVKPKLVPFNGQVQLVGDSLFATCCIASTVHVHVPYRPYTNSLKIPCCRSWVIKCPHWTSPNH